ncbi:unnamed protein product [Acanthosepion pharaonis]|uniref:Uncharacterized protein n=1 Tax=Acanthosepion pharaonis TaxID=158019 RepID=A0A812E912_ACAPH|nr:unnamed protein product [Sepia pharaonis]
MTPLPTPVEHLQQLSGFPPSFISPHPMVRCSNLANTLSLSFSLSGAGPLECLLSPINAPKDIPFFCSIPASVELVCPQSDPLRAYNPTKLIGTLTKNHRLLFIYCNLSLSLSLFLSLSLSTLQSISPASLLTIYNAHFLPLSLFFALLPLFSLYFPTLSPSPNHSLFLTLFSFPLLPLCFLSFTSFPFRSPYLYLPPSSPSFSLPSLSLSLCLSVSLSLS